MKSEASLYILADRIRVQLTRTTRKMLRGCRDRRSAEAIGGAGCSGGE